MQDIFQKTLQKNINFNGTGLHSGLTTKVNIIPSESNTGIVFKRVDHAENNIITANYKNVSSAKLCTTLENFSGIKVSTVEHLMAAFYITGIDNALVEIDNEEIPIMDGSSKNFIELINNAGLKIQNSKRKFLKIIEKVEIKENQKSISIEPSNLGFDVNFQINYANETIGKQKNHVQFYDSNLEEVYASRTFCLFEDIEKIKKAGLAKGGSLENAVVVKNKKILNKGGLRNSKEFVNHKILDLAGDFLLSGYRIIGSVKCEQGGHLFTNMFLKELFKKTSSFVELDLENLELIKKEFKTPENKIAINA
jgi:UDP-3-O-[3-hydroxymyristoyl] N-acetylglucosamine deacetylase